jgi:hypothetical protein
LNDFSLNLIKIKPCEKVKKKLIISEPIIMEIIQVNVNPDINRCGPDQSIGCSFKFTLKEGVEKSIVNAPRITDHGSAV